MLRKLLVIIFILITQNVNAAFVTDAIDGDTLRVIDGSGVTVIRLYGIDCPEKQQAHGMDAKQFMESMTVGKEVAVTKINTDRYGRTVAVVMLGNQCLQEQLLVSGYAWIYPQYCKKKFCLAWESLQRIAAANKWGLWADPMPAQPWVWRKQHR